MKHIPVLLLACTGCAHESPEPPKKAPPKVVLQFYDVKDLVRPVYNYLGHDGPNLEPPPEDPNDTRLEIDDLIEVIRATVEPTSWGVDGSDIQPKNGVLVVRATESTHQRLRAYVQELRGNAQQAKIVAAPEGK